jgi:hypothetical protein
MKKVADFKWPSFCPSFSVANTLSMAIVSIPAIDPIVEWSPVTNWEI